MAVWLTRGDLLAQCLLRPRQLGFPCPVVSKLPLLAFHLIPAVALLGYKGNFPLGVSGCGKAPSPVSLKVCWDVPGMWLCLR